MATEHDAALRADVSGDLLDGNGRWIGRGLERVAEVFERFGIRLGAVAAELRWRRWAAMRRWGA